MFPAED